MYNEGRASTDHILSGGSVSAEPGSSAELRDFCSESDDTAWAGRVVTCFKAERSRRIVCGHSPPRSIVSFKASTYFLFIWLRPTNCTIYRSLFRRFQLHCLVCQPPQVQSASGLVVPFRYATLVTVMADSFAIGRFNIQTFRYVE